MLFYMAALSKTRPILVQVQPSWMELMLKSKPWLSQVLLSGRTLGFLPARFLYTHSHLLLSQLCWLLW